MSKYDLEIKAGSEVAHAYSLSASWHGPGVAGTVMLYALDYSKDDPVLGSMELGEVYLPELLNEVANRKVGREAMIEALWRQRLRVRFDEWTPEDEQRLKDGLRDEEEKERRLRDEREERRTQKRERAEAEERERRELLARSASPRKQYMSLQELRWAEKRKQASDEMEPIRTAIKAAGGQPVDVACDFQMPDGSIETAVIATTTLHGIANHGEVMIRARHPGMKQHTARFVRYRLAK